MTNEVNTKVRNTMVSTKIILFGPMGFTGTNAFWRMVKAGVFSCIFALAFCAWVSMAL